MTDEDNGKGSESVLRIAARTTDHDRQEAYGNPSDSHARIAALWSIILETPVTAERVALCMVATKIARLLSEPTHFDSIVDLAGYARVYQRITDL